MLPKIRTLLKKKLDRILLYSIFSFMFLMAIGVIIFYFHYLHNPEGAHKPWSSDDGILIFTIFSTIFAGFNVLAFIALSFTIERQNSEREEKLAYYDGVRIKLQRQREIEESFRNLIPRYISSSYFIDSITNIADVQKAEILLKHDEFTILSIGGIKGMNDYLFKQVLKEDLRELGKFIKELDSFLEKYEKSADFSTFQDEIEKFYKTNGSFIPDVLIGIKEGINLDIQLTLFESLGNTVNGISIDMLPPKSKRYENNLRREKLNK